ncbi:hypothetical protein AVEN_95317-1 [Araneus ventricosus]|uniref:Integrase catalytic domain-containing protein n=1 Tax=Araneus ventricosus TaxID=182803 RepID=A0A4Y2UZR4_ARAVE|nr:hypothetical protein AVEN_95317-1 [Araneus ventricosus]
MAIRPFIARRSRPRTFYWDNGSNFKGTYNELSTFDWKKVVPDANNKKLFCQFNSPIASWWGGFWKRFVRVLEELLRLSLGKSILLFEELRNVLCDCESVINSRPLTYVSKNSDDLIPLTPSMILIENRNFITSDIGLVETQSFRKRIKFRINLLKDLNLRFRK